MTKSMYRLYLPLLSKGTNGNEILSILDSFVDADEVQLMERMNRFYKEALEPMEF